MTERNRLKDAEIAVEQHGWVWVPLPNGNKILLPPYSDPRSLWAAIWDQDGLPHWLPAFSLGDV